MKTNCLKLLIVAFCCGLFQGCAKDDVPVEKPVERTIKVEQGRLSFENQAHFDSVFNELMENQDLEYLKTWESQFGGFTSMRTAYDNLTEADFEKIAQSNSIKDYENILQIRIEDGEQEAAAVTDHPVMARIFNHEGLLLIGSDAFKLQKDKLIRIESYSEDKIRKALESTDQKTDYLGIERQVISQESPNLRTDGILDLDRTCRATYNTRYRFKGTFALLGTISVNPSGDWTSNFSGKFNAVLWLSQHKKRTAFIWFASRTKELRLDGTVTWMDDNGNLFPATLDPMSALNEKEIGYAYSWGTNYRATASVKSSGLDDNNNYHECTATR